MDFDLTMPTVLLLVTLVAAFLNRRVEGKLKGVLEEREFRIRDALLLVASITVTVLVVVWIPEFALMAIFLFAYSMLLFIFTYVFSDFSKTKANVFGLVFLVASLVAGIASQLQVIPNTSGLYGAVAFYGLSAFILATLIYERKRSASKERWYIAILPPALFTCLYAFYSKSPLWFPYLLDIYGAVFAVLIILYISSLFSWKTTVIFAGMLTVVDIILVLVTGSMVSAAKSVSGLRLPVLISLPIMPLILTEKGLQYMSLGLGDFFFAGLLIVQTQRKFGRAFGVLAAVAMAMSFAIFEIYLLYYNVVAFPGTLMLMCGWIPIAAIGLIRKPRNQ